ncbi:hypothetical protein K466DRAFT_44911 [Polyporus arcularius HHB13444]|uniref:Uncharacterized protein n=1 Tax=Polyporus arcularius HHB13444 TaxID=1314778 RepID=A0A5C3PLH9_9APHY|nr:hypothetical protein K466DRAFT_44911 [Polyporus arcularius HHB13444]
MHPRQEARPSRKNELREDEMFCTEDWVPVMPRMADGRRDDVWTLGTLEMHAMLPAGESSRCCYLWNSKLTYDQADVLLQRSLIAPVRRRQSVFQAAICHCMDVDERPLRLVIMRRQEPHGIYLLCEWYGLKCRKFRPSPLAGPSPPRSATWPWRSVFARPPSSARLQRPPSACLRPSGDPCPRPLPSSYRLQRNGSAALSAPASHMHPGLPTRRATAHRNPFGIRRASQLLVRPRARVTSRRGQRSCLLQSVNAQSALRTSHSRTVPRFLPAVR